VDATPSPLRRLWLRLLARFGPKALLPAIVLAAGLLGTTALVVVSPAARPGAPEVEPPVVEILEVQPRAVRLSVSAQGTVEPRTETELVSEVAGRVVWVSPRFEAGGFFRADEPLLRLDDRDPRNAVERAAAAVERAESELSLAEATAQRRRSLREAGASSRAALDEAESRAQVAAANLRDARARLDQAQHDLDRCTLRAPFDGRVRETRVDVGAYLAPGARVGRVFAVDYAEVRLPIPNADLAFLEVPLGYDAAPGALPEPGGEVAEGTDEEAAPASGSDPEGPTVRLRGRWAGREHTWTGSLVRTEGALDARTRMVHAVVRVEDPYARGEEGDAPLPVGLFVEAEIEGRLFPGLVELPRSALREDDVVVVVDEHERMERRRVEVVRVDRDRVFVGAGLRPGERVATTRLDVVVDGMSVRTLARGARPGASQPEGGKPGAAALARAGSAP
ncbi:MAG: efflux RND transporter periplasmic adaptor subunit, partial [Myxococcota bacterium]|nr:efflux RND transporter periplasmic adaptor subunit [Myxococcota bacterium]